MSAFSKVELMLLNGTAKLILWAAENDSWNGAAEMTLIAELKRLCGSNYGFSIIFLHVFERSKYGSEEFPLLQRLRLILVWFLPRADSQSCNINKTIYKTVKVEVNVLQSWSQTVPTVRNKCRPVPLTSFWIRLKYKG